MAPSGSHLCASSIELTEVNGETIFNTIATIFLASDILVPSNFDDHFDVGLDDKQIRHMKELETDRITRF